MDERLMPVGVVHSVGAMPEIGPGCYIVLSCDEYNAQIAGGMLHQHAAILGAQASADICKMLEAAREHGDLLLWSTR